MRILHVVPLLILISTSIQTFANSSRFSGTYDLISRSGHDIKDGQVISPELLEMQCPSKISIVSGHANAGDNYVGCSEKLKAGCPLVSVLDDNQQILMTLHDGNSKVSRMLSSHETATSSSSAIQNIERSPREFYSQKLNRISLTQIKLSYHKAFKDEITNSTEMGRDYQCVYQISKVSTALTSHPRNRLYRVSNSAGDSYILGTIHMGVGMEKFKTNLPELIKKSRVVLPEIDMTTEQLRTYKVDPLKALFEAMPLTSPVNPNKATVAKLEELGFPHYIAARLPDNACMSLQNLLLANPQRPSLDIQVLNVAHQNSLKIISLDSRELRASSRKESDTTSGACSLHQLVSTYTKKQILDSLNESLEQAITSYKNGESEKEEILNDPMVMSRNLAWMSTIEEEIKKGSAFVSVGNFHLQGNSGILQLLRDHGFSISLVE